MEIVEQLKSEVTKRAGSPDGLLRLIHLLLEEVNRIDVQSPDAPRQYFALLRAYVLVKRQLTIFNRRCEYAPIDPQFYADTFRSLKHAIKAKRDEAREYAAQHLSPEKLKELNQYAGTHMGFNMGFWSNGFRTGHIDYYDRRWYMSSS